MLMLRVFLVRMTDSRVTLGLSLPPGFRPEDLDGPSLRLNGALPAAEWGHEPKRDRPSDLFRAIHASFDRAALGELIEKRGGASLQVTGRLRRGEGVTGWCPLPANLVPARPSHPDAPPGPGESRERPAD